MSDRITWADKIRYKLSSLPSVQTWLFGDANEIKAVVNSHAQEIEDLQSGGGAGGDMTKVVYDAAAINEQLVGLTATQTLTNKTVNGVVLTDAGLQAESLRADGTYQVAATGAASSVDITAKVNEVGGITAGQVVYISGATGGFPTVGIASNNDYSKSDVLAIATETKADNQNIIVTTTGLVENIDTSAFTEGVQVYLGANGALTAVHPSGVLSVQRVGHIVKVNATTGSIIVEREPLTVIDDEDLTLRYTLVNPNAGASATSSFTAVNDLAHRISLSLTSSGFSAIPDLVEAMVLYNEGFGESVYTVDGNKDHVWATDTTDAHAFAATEKMRLTAEGCLRLLHSLDLIHTAGATDDHALEIDANANGFGDVKALSISYITGAINPADDESVMIVEIDETLSVGGTVAALTVLSSEVGAAEVDAILTGANVHPIKQLSGTFGNASSILNIAVDVTTALSSGGAGNITAFVNDNESITISSPSKFEEIEIILTTVASQNINPTFEFSTGVGTWGAFTPNDGTNGFRNTGEVLWVDSNIPSWAVGTGGDYLIRITRTRNNLTTSPILDLLQISALTEYTWDKDGNVLAKTFNGATLTSAGLQSDSLRADGTYQTLSKSSVGLGNVDNTSDANKPVSTATQTALDTKEDIFTDSTKIASFSPSGDDSTNFICDSASAIVVTIDTGALTATNKGMSFFHEGTGALTFINGTGTLTGSPLTSFVSEGTNSTIYIKRRSDGTYLMYGQTA